MPLVQIKKAAAFLEYKLVRKIDYVLSKTDTTATYIFV